MWTACGPGSSRGTSCRGEKCMPYGQERGSYWDATRCVPVAPRPNGVGEPCTVEGWPASGFDDCDAASMCYDVDPGTFTGTCVAFCIGPKVSPTCANPCSRCLLSDSSFLIICLPSCDPLAQDCARGNGCYPVDNAELVCAPDASGSAGTVMDPCQYLNVCDPGLFCASGELVAGCESTGCCVPYCDVAATDPCPQFPGAECVPVFDGGPDSCIPPEVGACLIP